MHILYSENRDGFTFAMTPESRDRHPSGRGRVFLARSEKERSLRDIPTVQLRIVAALLAGEQVRYPGVITFEDTNPKGSPDLTLPAESAEPG